MRKTIIAASIATAAFAVPNLAAAQATAAAAPASPHTFTGNFTLASEYLYRGIAQTRGKPAVQGGFDYSHSSGFYVGTWASNISWLSDNPPLANGNTTSAPIELDIYGGYKGTISGDLGFDVGLLTYNYPGSNKPTGAAKPDTTEIYGALTYKWLSLKYSSSTGSLFGWTKTIGGGKTTGSGYLDLTGTWDMGSGWGLSAHAGHQGVRGRSSASYSDWKVGVTKDLGFGTVGVAFSDTNAKDNCASGEDYCFGGAGGGGGAGPYSAGKGRMLVTFGKTF
jgi:uncharacterized protein (TIGR02001 family)